MTRTHIDSISSIASMLSDSRSCAQRTSRDFRSNGMRNSTGHGLSLAALHTRAAILIRSGRGLRSVMKTLTLFPSRFTASTRRRNFLALTTNVFTSMLESILSTIYSRLAHHVYHSWTFYFQSLCGVVHTIYPASVIPIIDPGSCVRRCRGR